MMRSPARGRRGVTLVEMLVALAVFGIVMTAAMGFIRTQSAALRLGTDRMGAIQNAQFAMSTLTSQLRTAGGGVLDQQPFIVYAGPNVVAFNADYATNVANDPFAVYYDADAPTGTVTALRGSQQITVPLTAFAYPDSTYEDEAGNPSPAETIIFYVTPDSSTPRTDDYALFRQVNADAPELVARDILATPGTPFFQYYRLVSPPDEAARVDSIPASRMPLAHTVVAHLSPADTGAEAVVDSIRAVRVTLTVTDGDARNGELHRTISRLIRLPNAGLASRHTCGDPPQLGASLGATAQTLSTGDVVVNLSWAPAVDDAGGEKDVVRYVIWRKFASGADWGDPYLSIPSGNTSYTYTDAAVQRDSTYVYQLAAQDCSPALSGRTTSPAVTVVP
ncbi:MAG TPA: prepilin-type N-terminal cleavage/methylation domain-containing protein [Gemmatimonadaceae bacterium]|nr:prepilin-type N-terminal cleavage/methylation domain-containing protein [Gemmatimonadaceae bacterium]